ncbi:hypothetical protein [Lactiplantibacillus plantarum]|uniref:hypothetical protein n=1 Tax=Lactiplantibacillus plantarum TaxID=1590 RepID=UPI001BA8B766|nr:hypothetical protein [Lactiplantibacillus plantarum]MBS0937495.1 hypothetical protein [Lactiplantibacillus plantarum]MBS0945644.1 hypothetical protein [Lactiplantibacillus plantarum]
MAYITTVTVIWKGVGTLLKEAYSDAKNAQKRHDLIALGDLSFLGRSLEPSVAVELFGFGYYMKPEFNKLSQHAQDLLSADARGGNFTVAYHRDRGEKRK